jgi:hypothetical protein
MTFHLKEKYLTNQVTKLIQQKLILGPSNGLYNAEEGDLPLYSVVKNGLNIPLNFKKDVEKLLGIELKHNNTFEKKKISFYQTLKDDPVKDQVDLCREALDMLRKDGYCMLAPFPGYGKTACGTYLATRFSGKFVVICFLAEVQKKWVQYLKQYTSGRVQYLTSNNLDTTCDIFVCGPKAFFSNISYMQCIPIIIIDECQRGTESIFTALLDSNCKYLIGLSGTPDRTNRLNKVFPLFFGENFIYREEVKEFVVVKYNTKYKATRQFSYNPYKRKHILNWDVFCKSLYLNSDRNDEIVELCLNHPHNKIIVFCKYVKQADYIYEKLINLEENVIEIIGKKKVHIDKNYRILVTTVSKCGVGYDDVELNMMILGFTIRDPRQPETRLRGYGIIYDIVDNDSTAEDHWDLREKWYTKRGATIKSMGDPHKFGKVNIMPDKKFLI